MSKCAVNAMGKSLAIEWEKTGVAVGLMHPGYVKTGKLKFKFSAF